MAYTTAAMLTSGKSTRPKLKDFVLRWGNPNKRRQTAEEQLNIFRALAARMQGQERRGDNR